MEITHKLQTQHELKKKNNNKKKQVIFAVQYETHHELGHKVRGEAANKSPHSQVRKKQVQVCAHLNPCLASMINEIMRDFLHFFLSFVGYFKFTMFTMTIKVSIIISQEKIHSYRQLFILRKSIFTFCSFCFQLAKQGKFRQIHRVIKRKF